MTPLSRSDLPTTYLEQRYLSSVVKLRVVFAKIMEIFILTVYNDSEKMQNDVVWAAVRKRMIFVLL